MATNDGINNSLDGQTGTGTYVGSDSPTITTQIAVTGEANITHTSTSTDDHALEVDVDAAGYGDVKAVEVEYITGAIAAGDEEAAILVNVDESAATGGDVFGIEILATDGSADIYGTGHGVNVNPIAQFSGTFGDMDYARYTTSGGGEVDCLAAFISSGTDVTLFTADNDYIIIGDAAQFSEIEFLWDTVASGAGVKPEFYYSTGGSGFTQFTPTDGTNGMRFNGVVAWVPDSISGSWVTNASGNYEIKIVRTQNSLGTPPIEDLVQIATTVLYEWDKDGALDVKSIDIDASQAYSVAGTAILSDSAGTMTLSNVDALDATTAATIGAATKTLTNTTFDANGTGNSLSNVDVADLANGTDGEIITWDSSGVATTVSAGTSGQVLTSSGAGAEPTFKGQIYDIPFNAGFAADGTTEDCAVQTYGELVVARTGSFTGEAGYVDVAPTGAALIVDIEKNGTTIYSSKPQFAAAANTLSAGTLKTDGTEDFVSGDRITFKVTQIGSTNPGDGCRFTVKAEAY